MSQLLLLTHETFSSVNVCLNDFLCAIHFFVSMVLFAIKIMVNFKFLLVLLANNKPADNTSLYHLKMDFHI